MARLSIIVPVYNAERYLERCVRSILAQTMGDLEVLLIDDSSTDASLALCHRLAEEDGRVRVFSKENEGAGRARNAALPHITGEFLGFVDSDDYVAPDMFETLLKKAEEYSADLVLSGVVFEDGTMFSDTGAVSPKLYFTEDTVFDTAEKIRELQLGVVGARPEDEDDSKYGMSIWKNLFRAEIIKQNGLQFESEREMLSEDALFLLDFLSHATRAVGIPNAFYHYVRNPISISKSYKADRFEKSLVFVEQAKRRVLPTREERIYFDRFWQAMCRVLRVQEILYAKAEKRPYSALKARLSAVCSHPMTERVLREYPIHTLPMGQRVFALALKHKQYRLLTLLVGLRNK